MYRIKKNKTSKYMIIGIVYIIILLSISVAYSFLNEDLSLKATAGIPQNGTNYIIDYTEILNQTKNSITSYGYDVILTYLGENTTTGWEVYIKIPYDTEVTECYNASSCTVEGEVLTIKSDTTNSILSPDNNSTSFRIKFKTSKSDYTFEVTGVKFMEENGESTTNAENNTTDIPTIEYINANYSTLYNWGSSKQYTFKVENTSDTVTIHSWSATFNIPNDATINSLWGGEKLYDEVTRILTISGPTWSPSLSPKSSAEINMIINSSSGTPPTALDFVGITSTGEKVRTTIKMGGI